MATQLLSLTNTIKTAISLGLTVEPYTGDKQTADEKGTNYTIKWVGRTLFIGPVDRCADFVRGYATAKGLFF